MMRTTKHAKYAKTAERLQSLSFAPFACFVVALSRRSLWSSVVNKETV